MKALLVMCMVAGLAVCGMAAEKIFLGTSMNDKDIVAVYNRGRFFADAKMKQQIYAHPGNMVSTEAKATPKNSIYRLMGDRIFKGFSIKKEDCLATIFAIRTQKGYVKEGKIYEGWKVIRDVVEKHEKGGITINTSFKVTADGINAEANPKVLFTIKDGRMYRGDSTADKDCALSWTGDFDSSRLLFMAVELTKK